VQNRKMYSRNAHAQNFSKLFTFENIYAIISYKLISIIIGEANFFKKTGKKHL